MAGRLTLGLALGMGAPATQYVTDARRAAELGFDVVELPDHLGMVAPVTTLAAIATAVPDVHVTNHVLNAAFYRPHLLARDIAAVHQLSGGRFITSLGAGYAEGEFETAGIPFPTAGQRVQAVRETAIAIRDILADPTYVAPTDLPLPPTRIAGKGDRLLTVAAEHADFALIDPVVTESELEERIEFVRSKARHRSDDIGFSFPFTQVALDDPDDLDIIRRALPQHTDDRLRALPTVLTGTVDDAVAKIARIRRLGVDFLSFIRTPKVSWDGLGRLVEGVRAAGD